jgi:S1-C subfamily serine protease
MKLIKYLLFSLCIGLGYAAWTQQDYNQRMDLMNSVVVVALKYNKDIHKNNQVIGYGSGVIIKETDTHVWILSAEHVTRHAPDFPDSTYVIQNHPKDRVVKKLRIYKEANHYDLALVSVRKPLPFNYKVSRICEYPTQIMEKVYSIGYPVKLGKTISEGIVSDPNSLPYIKGRLMRLVQHSASLAPGNSGGGLFVKQGFTYCLAGINIYGFPGYDFLNAAVSLYDIKHFLGEQFYAN